MTPDMVAAADRQVANFHRNLRLVRLRKGMSQEAAASAIGFNSRQAVQRLERDVGEPLLVTACLVANGLGVGLGELLAEFHCPQCNGAPPAGYTCNICYVAGQ